MIARLCYASIRVGEQEGLLEDIFDILTTARNFNLENDICGVLYYADNSFFQCLEGEREIIENLFRKISQDPRHHTIKHFFTNDIDKISFKNWSMKYVKRASSIDAFLKSKGCEKFEPHSLKDEDLPEFIDRLFLAHQEDQKPKKKIGYSNRGVNPLA